MIISVNNKVVCEPYKSAGAIKSEIKNGFASVIQKKKLVGLKILVDYSDDKRNIPSGSIAYILEERLHATPDYQKSLDSDLLDQPFVLIDFSAISAIKLNKE